MGPSRRSGQWRRSRLTRRGLTLLIGAVFALSLPGASLAAQPLVAHSVFGLITSNGRPVSGVGVVVRAVPSTATLHAAPAGVSIVLPVVGNARTDAAGRFGLDPSVPASFVGPDGSVSLEITAQNGGQTLDWTFPIWPRNKFSSQLLASTNPSTPGRVGLAFEFGASSGVRSFAAPATTGDAIASVAESAWVAQPAVTPSDGANPLVCSIIPSNNFQYGRDETFANVWSWSGAQVDFTEDFGTSHTLGIGGQGATIIQEGVTVLNEDSTSAVKSGLYDNEIHNAVNYREFAGSCWSPANRWYPDSSNAFFSKVLGWPVSAHPTNYVACHQYSNTTYTKETGTNTTVSAGVSLQGGYVSAQAGWNSSSSEKYNFGATTNSWFCASTSAGVNSSPQVEAHKV
jgi:predicted RecA/RadA family phage recombinase